MSDCPFHQVRNDVVHPEASITSHYSDEFRKELIEEIINPDFIKIIVNAINIHTSYERYEWNYLDWKESLLYQIKSHYGLDGISLEHLSKLIRNQIKKEDAQQDEVTFIDQSPKIAILIAEGGIFTTLSNKIKTLRKKLSENDLGLSDKTNFMNLISEELNPDLFINTNYGSRTFHCIGQLLAKSIAFGVLVNVAIKKYNRENNKSLPNFTIQPSYRNTLKAYDAYLKQYVVES